MRVEIHTDGSCLERKSVRSPGGWAAVLRSRLDDSGGTYYPHERVIQGAQWEATPIQMELMAVYQGLAILNDDALSFRIHVYTDCEEVIDIVGKKYNNWMHAGWRDRMGLPIPDQELIQAMMALVHKYDAMFHWVKSHANNGLNNRVDDIAREACKALIAERKDDLIISYENEDITLSAEERDALRRELTEQRDVLDARITELKSKKTRRVNKRLAECRSRRNMIIQILRKIP